MQSITNKQRFILIGAIVLLIAFIVFMAVRRGSDNSSQPKVTSYYDADSGQTVTDIEGKSPELSDAEAGPTFLGFQELTKTGTTQNQLDNIRNALTIYSNANAIKEVSLKVDTIKTKPRDPKVIKSVVEFEIKFDRKPVYYKVNAESTGITRTQVRLYDTTGALLFDSGVLNGSPGSD